MMRERAFGAMAASAIILNALYILAGTFLSPKGVEYPVFDLGGIAALILGLILYALALIAILLWLLSHLGHPDDKN